VFLYCCSTRRTLSYHNSINSSYRLPVPNPARRRTRQRAGRIREERRCPQRRRVPRRHHPYPPLKHPPRRILPGRWYALQTDDDPCTTTPTPTPGGFRTFRMVSSRQ
jgi:hypothetical protein